MAYWGYPRYVSVAEKRAKAAKKLKQLKKKNPSIKPIVIEGGTIARTWWGKSWNLNLERYADYSNRIGRGRSYVRHGAVLDLKISSGQVESLVQGTRSKPYTVIIKIKGIKKKIWQNMKAALFPSPEEIEFNCSCPDWAYMCKHVAATLYGIGTRLDDSPSLFFKLRKVNIDDLIQQTIKDQSYKLLKKAEKTRAGMIAESDLSGMFGIDMEDHIDFDLPKSGKKVSSRGKTSRKAAKPAKTKLAKRKPKLKTSAKEKADRTSSEKTGLRKTARLTDTAQFLNIIKRSKKGVDVAALKQKTGFDEKKIRNMIYKAHKKGIIRRGGRGIYMGTKQHR